MKSHCRFLVGEICEYFLCECSDLVVKYLSNNMVMFSNLTPYYLWPYSLLFPKRFVDHLVVKGSFQVLCMMSLAS